MSDTHIHLHIPVGYQLALFGNRVTIAPIGQFSDARDRARDLANDPSVAAAAAQAIGLNVRGKGVSIRWPPSLDVRAELRRISDQFGKALMKPLGRKAVRAKAKRERVKQSRGSLPRTVRQ